MKTTKQQRLRKKVFLVIVIIIIVAMALVYILPLQAMAADTPPPDQYGTDYGYDDTTLPMPGDTAPAEEVPPPPMLTILDTNIQLDIGQERQIQIQTQNIPDGTTIVWTSENSAVAGVDAGGRVVAYSAGRTQIFVTAGDVRSSVLVSVNELKANKLTISVEDGVSQLTSNSYQVAVADVVNLKVSILPDGAKVS